MILRPYPYPYEAMLSICSDLDETPAGESYFHISRYLNTADVTPIGDGVELEVGNTIYFNMPGDQFSYWSTNDSGRDRIHALIKSGHIDCFHSFGDRATLRADMERSLESLAQHDCHLEVWIDHSTAVSNFGRDIMRGRGDLENEVAYHADLTIKQGVKYVWLGRVTSLIGQNAPYDFRRLLDVRHPVASIRNAGKDFTKSLLARAGSDKYCLHKENLLTRPYTLRSGHHVTEFMRCNPHAGGVSGGDNARGIADVLSARNLENLLQSRGVSIIYTHLGKQLQQDVLFAEETRVAFRRLAEYFHSGRILVSSTVRNLKYHTALADARVETLVDNGVKKLLVSVSDGVDPSGITIYYEDGAPLLFLNGKEVAKTQHNSPDATGFRSVSFPWASLSYPL